MYYKPLTTKHNNEICDFSINALEYERAIDVPCAMAAWSSARRGG
jgi:hypothetical protein